MKGRYRLHGLTVESDVVLEAEPAPEVTEARTTPDLSIVLGRPGEVPTSLPPGRVVAQLDTPEGRLRHVVVQQDDGWLIRFPGAAEVELDVELLTATAHIDPAFPEDLFSVLAAGFVVATVLQLRGDAVLHASAVELDGRALAVVGPSGTGKSTTAALLCAAGGRLVTDDVLRLARGTGAPQTWRGPATTRLRDQAAALAGGGATTSADGRTVARHTRAASDQLELGGVLLPRPRRDLEEVEVAELSGMSALLPLVSAPRILGWRDEDSLARQLQQLSALCAAVPVVEVHMPWGPPFAADLGARVVAALRRAHVLAADVSSPSTA